MGLVELGELVLLALDEHLFLLLFADAERPPSRVHLQEGIHHADVLLHSVVELAVPLLEGLRFSRCQLQLAAAARVLLDLGLLHREYRMLARLLSDYDVPLSLHRWLRVEGRPLEEGRFAVLRGPGLIQGATISNRVVKTQAEVRIKLEGRLRLVKLRGVA